MKTNPPGFTPYRISLAGVAGRPTEVAYHDSSIAPPSTAYVSDARPNGVGSSVFQGPRVLMVDDDDRLLRSLSRVVRLGLDLPMEQLVTASNLISACELFDAHSPSIQVVITDMNMPTSGDGLRFYRHIRQKGQWPIAVLSGGMGGNERAELDNICKADLKCSSFVKGDAPDALMNWIGSYL